MHINLVSNANSVECKIWLRRMQMQIMQILYDTNVKTVEYKCKSFKKCVFLEATCSVFNWSLSSDKNCKFSAPIYK